MEQAMTKILLTRLVCTVVLLAGVSAGFAAPSNPENHSII
jgi:hypothetical protein